jgi:CheY-like chemotaxis protein
MAIAHLSPRLLAAGARRTREPNGLNCKQCQAPSPAVLLAYSGRSNREYLAVFLAGGGYDVTPCKDGREALARVSAGGFDLVVTGIVMPCLDGLELLRALRRRPGSPPVIAVADSASKIDRIYLRYATLSGAVATHTVCEMADPFLKSVDWILRGRDHVRNSIVW